ncbi:hypothetical protein NC652_023991 [Populus alba x Populus x berolinensis]|uniref:Uncharacterized protein n=1 Tax=Populus alba x Populus x berolinensis TaxID=444605 RepID=A0AAD6MK76_9ROSI|nr:hypothetical protein NC652_023991 [Populus alba x Populus x berolinensis]KAJ6985802.1 hypothetical protein NC653_023669 [Populus alba x Populus x berolinensis]
MILTHPSAARLPCICRINMQQHVHSILLILIKYSGSQERVKMNVTMRFLFR